VYYKVYKLAGFSQHKIMLTSKIHRWAKMAKEKAEVLIQGKMSAAFGVLQNSGIPAALVPK